MLLPPSYRCSTTWGRQMLFSSQRWSIICLCHCLCLCLCLPHEEGKCCFPHQGDRFFVFVFVIVFLFGFAYHMRKANAVFLTKVISSLSLCLSDTAWSISQDFDNNNKSDCIGFQVDKKDLSMCNSYQNRLRRSQSWRRSIPMSTFCSATTTSQRFLSSRRFSIQHFQDFLRKFSRYNFAQYCLGLLFTNRLFKVLTPKVQKIDLWVRILCWDCLGGGILSQEVSEGLASRGPGRCWWVNA